MSLDVEGAKKKKKYSPPDLTQRSREKATLFLVGHAWIGDAGARDLLKLFFPEPGLKIEQENSVLPSSQLTLPRDEV